MDWSRPYPQPDDRSCGAAVLVTARMVGDPAYAELVLTGRHPVTGAALPAGAAPVPDPVAARFAAEVLAMHRRTTGPVDVRGTLQLPWPRFLGTPPWAVARQLTGTPGRAGTTYRTRLVTPWGRRRALAGVTAATRAGHVVPLYVGSRWCPRHVVLVLDEELLTYDPATGGRVRLRPADLVAGRLGLRRWSTPWFVVLPEVPPAATGEEEPRGGAGRRPR